MATLSRKERDRQLRRADIFKAAEHLFALKGYHRATIRDIAKEAQYATGTVYLHFKDKDDLYFALFKEKMKRLLSIIIEEKEERAKDARSKLKIFVQESLAFFEENRDFFRIFSSEEDRVLVETKLLKSPTIQQLQEYITKLIMQAQEERVIRRDLDPRQARDVFSAIFKTVVLAWLQDRKEEHKSLIDLSDLILRYFLNGTANK
jgi:AcrR family transcriptional regulator